MKLEQQVHQDENAVKRTIYSIPICRLLHLHTTIFCIHSLFSLVFHLHLGTMTGPSYFE